MAGILHTEKTTLQTLSTFMDEANWRGRERHCGTVQVHVLVSAVFLSKNQSHCNTVRILVSGAVVLRVPVLFGEVESVTESAVTSLWLKVQQATEESCTVDHCDQRFPTDARDVAAVCRKLSERARQVDVRERKMEKDEDPASAQHLSVCLFVCLSVCLSICPSVCPSVRPSVCLSSRTRPSEESSISPLKSR